MLLEIKDLTIKVNSGPGATRIVDDVSLRVAPQQLVGLVGGSGSGKTTTGLAIMGLLAEELSVTSGSILFEGVNLRQLNSAQMRTLRGKEIAMVFQEPLYAFNPVLTVGFQIDEVLAFHSLLNAKERRAQVVFLLEQVGIKEPQRVSLSYPHQLSGGMRQRAMLAQALAAEPKLLIADEPTSNLDVTLQARVLELFRDLVERTGLSILLITHDLGVVQHFTDTVYVMNRGRVVEKGKTERVIQSPQDEYTRQLLAAVDA